ncbi:MAG: hypothetical protein QW112_02535 [Candidatus Micrarchaeia archaeon]
MSPVLKTAEQKAQEQINSILKQLDVKPGENRMKVLEEIIKNNHISNTDFDLQFNKYVSANSILKGLKTPESGQTLEDAKNSRREAKNALAVLYSLVNMKPVDRVEIISRFRKVRESDQYSDLPGELDITSAHIDSAVLYSVKDILNPKKSLKSSRKRTG